MPFVDHTIEFFIPFIGAVCREPAGAYTVDELGVRDVTFRVPLRASRQAGIAMHLLAMREV